VAACGSTPSATPSSPAASGNVPGSSAAGLLATGLSANLDKLDSYQFYESMPTSTTGAGASSGASSSSSAPLVVNGTVINRPVKSIYVNGRPAQFIVVGSQAWRSIDGNTWIAGDPLDTFLTDLLPGHDYGTWFDAKATFFRAVGDEQKNGVDCIHYQGDPSLGSLYGGAGGSSAGFRADLWIAATGDYPVSGVYGFTDPTGSQGGSWGFTFDVSHANDPANVVLAPANVVAIPT
jgi:hypothetical protein